MEEASNNVSAHADVLAENINHNENQGDKNDLVSSHGESNNSIAPLPDTDFEQGHDVFTPTNIPNNMQLSEF